MASPCYVKIWEVLVEELANINGVEDIALTTNASILTVERARELKKAGLKRITVSLDAINENTFKQMNDMDVSVQRVLDGIDNARVAGFDSIKINMVVQKGCNEDELIPMAKYFKETDYILRFIEYMDVGNTNGWDLSQVISGKEIINRIQKTISSQADRSAIFWRSG